MVGFRAKLWQRGVNAMKDVLLYSSIFWRRLGWVFSILVLFFLIAPIVIVLPLSFSSGSFFSYPLPGISMRWYSELFDNYKWVLALKNSMIIAVSSAALSTVLGISASIALCMTDIPFKKAIYALLLAPLVMPLVIVAVACFLFYSQLGLTGSRLGLILAHTALGVPYVIIVASAALKNFDMTLIKAARSLGASSIMTFKRVIFPAIAPAVFAGAIFAFVSSFDEIVITIFLAGPEQVTLPVRLLEGIRDEMTPVVVSAAVIMIMISMGAMLVAEMIRRRSERLSKTGTERPALLAGK
jgi:putative spermidine/putrescine transport system permease protein